MYQAAFLQDVCEHPDDDAPRLIYADWLDERGGKPERARAAFIRAQVRLAALGLDDPGRPNLEDEAQDLLAENEKEWMAAWPEEVGAREFRRGFVERASLDGAAFLKYAPQLMALGPLRELHLTLPDRLMADLAACPYLANVEVLDFGAIPKPGPRHALYDRELRTLLASPHLARLHGLGLSGQSIGIGGVQALTQSPWLANLRYLDLSSNYGILDEGARILAGATRAGRLEELRLHDTGVTFSGIWALFSTRCLPALHTLDVAAGILFAAPRDNAAYVRRVLAQPLAARLKVLDLSSGYGVGTLLPLLTSSPGLPQLASLNLNACGIGDAGAALLAQSPYLAGLTTLRLADNMVHDTGVKALANATHLKRLVRLELAHNEIGGPGLRELAASPNLSALQELDLSENYVGAASVEALAVSPYLRNLSSLSLRDVKLEADGARALAEAPNLGRLRRLDLYWNKIGDSGVAALAASPHLPRLTELVLSGNRLGKAGAEALAASPHLRRLRRLDLGNNNNWTDTEWRLLQDRFGSALVR